MLMIHQRKPLLWMCLFFTTFGLLCSLVSFVLPYWYARFPDSKNRFVRLGLWEICFEDFMPADLGNLMYTGCFYLYDLKIRALWSLIFRSWFVVCQAFHTCSFITYVLMEVVLLAQVCNLVSPRGPRAVLFSIIASGLTCLFILIGAVTMGTGVDAESKRKPVAEQDWLASLDQCSLSWAYGLAVLSLSGCIVPLVILCWCVYPKRSSRGLLSLSAWDWPTRNDLICRYHMNDLRTLSSQTQSLRSRSVVSGTASGPTQYDRSTLSEHVSRASVTTRDMLVSARPSSARSSASRARRNQSSSSSRRKPRPVPEPTSQGSAGVNTNGKLSSYDPRSPDTVSLLSYEVERLAPVKTIVHSPPKNTVSELSSIVTQESCTKAYHHLGTRFDSGVPAQEGRSEMCSFEPPDQLSAATVVLTGPAGSMPLSGGKSANLRSAANTADTSAWTTTDSSIQAARPMRRSRSKSASKQSSGRSASPPTRSEPVEPEQTIEQVSLSPVQAAKPMRRKYR